MPRAELCCIAKFNHPTSIRKHNFKIQMNLKSLYRYSNYCFISWKWKKKVETFQKSIDVNWHFAQYPRIITLRHIKAQFSSNSISLDELVRNIFVKSICFYYSSLLFTMWRMCYGNV